jgi:tetratricopeptide (TPR) repeat protein
MKYAVGIVCTFLAFLLAFSCATVDPLKDLPEAEYQKAQKYRERIAALNFSQYAPDEYAAGETAYKAGEENYKKDNLAAKASFDQANENYHTVIVKGIRARMKMSEDEIRPVKEKAVDIKADVAAKEEYKAASDAHDRAVTLANEEKWEEAEPVFAEAKENYEKAYTAAKEKKDKADTQFDETNDILDRLKGLVKDEEVMPAPEEDIVPEEVPAPEDEMAPEEQSAPEDEMAPEDEPVPEDEMAPEDEVEEDF